MGTISGPFSIPDGLIYHIDPANPKSYSGVGTIIYDMSGNNNTSYFTNGAFYENYSKGVVVVDGNNDYISTPLFNLTSPVTVSAWVKNVVNDSPVMGASGAGVNYGNGEVLLYFSGKSILVQGNNSGGKYYQFPQLNLNQWACLVMTRDVSNNMSVYLDGIGSTSNPQSHSNTIQLNQIGRYSAFTNIYNPKGSIGEVKIYNRALSQSEVLQNYNASKKRYLPEENIVSNGLVLNVDSTNYLSYVGSGTSWIDTSGNNNHLTLANGPTFTGTNGGIFTFDGINDNANRAFTWPTNFTFDLFCKPISSDGGFSRIIGTGDVFEFAISNASEIKYYHPGVWASTGATITFGSYVQLCGVKSGSNFYIYKNSVLVYSGSITLTSVNFLYLSSRHNGTELVSSSIGEVKIYNRALSASEIGQNFNATKSRYNI